MADVLTTRELVTLNPRPTIAQIRKDNPYVSSMSRFSQMVWKLDQEHDGLGPAIVDFRDTPPALRNAAKMMVWLALGGSMDLAPRKVGTVIAIPEKFREVFGTMRLFAHRLDRLGPAHFAFFRDKLKDDNPVVDGVGPAKYPVRMALQVWRDLHSQARAFRDAGMPALGFDPFEHEALNDVVKSFACRESDKREALPDDIQAMLFVEAEKWLERASDLVSLQNRVLHLLAESGGVAVPAILAEVRRGPYRREGDAPWHVVPGSVRTGAMAVLHLRDLIGTLDGAMSHMVLHELGQRPSEYVSMEGGFDAETGLPGCVERMSFPEEGVDMFLVHGTKFKMEREPVPDIWVAGTTPKGSNLPPPAVRAIEVLDWIHAPWRGESEKLLVSFNFHPDPATREASMGKVRMRKVREHLSRFHATADWSSLAGCGGDTAVIAKDRGDEIVPSNMRKGVSNWFVRLDARLLEPVSVQLKHDSVEETEEDYVTDDPTLMEPAREFASMEVARLMLKSSGALYQSSHGLPATHLPHLADIAALRERLASDEVLAAVDQLVVERDLSKPRTPVAQTVQPPSPDRADALLDQYRVTRTIWLGAAAVGRRREYASFETRAARIAERLAAMGIDPPTDGELNDARGN
ncbi:MAG: hypothetical protein V4472_17545 [Pseudomonadota bacterium]